jgi:hypothetical protein
MGVNCVWNLPIDYYQIVKIAGIDLISQTKPAMTDQQLGLAISIAQVDQLSCGRCDLAGRIPR